MLKAPLFKFFFFILVFGFQLKAQPSKVLDRLFTKIKYIDHQMNPNLILYNGFHPEEIYYIELDEYADIFGKYEDAYADLEAIPDSSLTNQERISKKIMFLKLTEQMSFIEYKMYLIPFNAEGGFFNAPAYYLDDLPFETIEDYGNYLNWLPSFSKFMVHHQKLLEKGVKAGIVAPKVVTESNISLLLDWVKPDVSKHPFYQPFNRFPDHFSQSTKDSILKIGVKKIRSKILPAYQSLNFFLKNGYLTVSQNNIGVSELPNGKEYYENRVAYYTTLKLTPDSIFNLGYQEVETIRNKMEGIIRDLNFEGDWNDFLKYLRTDPKFYAKTPQELLNYAAWLSKKAEGKLPLYFSKLYSLPFTIEPVPPEIAPSYTSGRYVHGDPAKNKPGTYWVNTYDLPSRTLYTLPALTLHEAVPGHHLQTTLAAEIKDLPEFRNLYYISAFGEGWALYCEYLGEEMGMYENPYDLFGRYTYEMWRACRLVVDVGIHYKGWSKEQALEFMKENTALSIHEIETEINRYIGWPGQALSYKVGELTIKSLRKRAEKDLGENFDLREFHNCILKNGSVPLPILEEEVDRYIKKNAIITNESTESQ